MHAALRHPGCGTLFAMNTRYVLVLIDAEIATLQQARTLITGTGKKRPGRPVRAPTAKRKGRMSPEGKARLVAALKARWAKKKRAAK